MYFFITESYLGKILDTSPRSVGLCQCMSLISRGKKEAFLNMLISKNAFKLVGGPRCPDCYKHGSFYSRL